MTEWEQLYQVNQARADRANAQQRFEVAMRDFVASMDAVSALARVHVATTLGTEDPMPSVHHGTRDLLESALASLPTHWRTAEKALTYWLVTHRQCEALESGQQSLFRSKPA